MSFQEECDFLANAYNLIFLPLNYPLRNGVVIGNYSQAVIYFSKNSEPAFQKVAELKCLHPKISVFLAKENASAEEVRRGFKTGVADFFTGFSNLSSLYDCIETFLSGNPEKQKEGIGWPMQALKNKICNLRYRYFNVSKNQAVAFPAKRSNPGAPVRNTDINAMYLGRFRLFYKGKQLDLPRSKVKNILAYLIFFHSVPQHRDKLMEKFWPGTAPSSARNCLNVAVHAIRKSFEQVEPHRKILLFNDEFYQFDPELTVEKDIDKFEYCWSVGNNLEQMLDYEESALFYNQAIAHYQGDFLEDLIYEDWAESERVSLQETYIVILDRLSRFNFEKKEFKKAIELCKKALLLDACLENIHRRLMDCYLQIGRREKAAHQYMKCVEVLKKELGVSPSALTLELYKKI